MRELEKDRDVHLRKIIDLIVPVTEYYPQKLRNTKKDLENLSKFKNNTARLNPEGTKGETIEDILMKLECERCEDNKCLFLQFIHSELKFHAAALQKMSELFYNINKKEPYEDLIKFAEDNRIEVDFENDLGIKINEINKEKQKREKEEKKKAKEVYESNDDDEIKVSVNKIKESRIVGSQITEGD